MPPAATMPCSHPSFRSRAGIIPARLRRALLLGGLLLGGLVAVPAGAQTVSNLDTTTVGSSSVFVSGSPGNFTYYFAGQTFTTGSSASTLDSITLSFNDGSYSANVFQLSLWSDNSGSLGSQIEILSGEANPRIGSTYTYTSGASTALAANTTYWWVATNTSNGAIFELNYTSDTSEDPGAAAGWSIGDVRHTGSSNDGSINFSTTGAPFQFSVAATLAVPEPSTYALLAGLMVLGICVWRRRVTA